MIRRVSTLIIASALFSTVLRAQEEKNFIQRGEIHGNFQVEAQY